MEEIRESFSCDLNSSLACSCSVILFVLSLLDAGRRHASTNLSKIIYGVHRLIRLLLSRARRWGRGKKGEKKPFLEGQHMARLAEPLSYGFWSFGDERGRRSWVYLTLVPPPRPRGFSPRIPASRSISSSSFHGRPYSWNALQSLVLSFRVPQSCLSESWNDYRYGRRRWPNIRVNPSVKL